MKEDKFMNILDKFNSSKNTNLLVVICIIICLAVGGLSFQYYIKLQKTIETESSDYLQELSKQLSQSVSKTINDNFSVLSTISSVLKNTNVSNYGQLQMIVREQKNFWNYKNILLIDQNSDAYDAYGRRVLLGNNQYLQDALCEDKTSMSSSEVVGGKEDIIFIMPIAGVNIEGKQIRAIAATYDLSTFDKILSLNAFDGKAYSHILRKDGTIVIRSSSPNAFRSGYSFASSLAQATITSNSSVQQFKEDIASGKSGFMSYTLDNIGKYMVYTPLATNEWALVTMVPTDAVNAKSQIFLKATLIICGFITLTFTILLIVLMRSSYQHRKNLEQIAYVDPITKGHTIQKFIELVSAKIRNNPNTVYAMIFTNIEKFKILNEQFGRHACDVMLRSIHNGILEDLHDNEFIGRNSADNFCILVEFANEKELDARFNKWYNQISKTDDNGFWLSPLLEFGVYIITDKTMAITSMIDRAKIALTEISGEFGDRLRYSIYNDVTGQRMLRERQLEDMTETALAEREFQVYLQPKYISSSEKIGGAEALVRWVSKKEGLIFPNEFIPLFEKNGFIVQLDLYVFEEVCKTIRKWLDAGKEPVKISVNCSRIQLKKHRFWDKYTEIANRYAIPLKYLEIELTESVVFEDVERLSNLIQEIRNAGFGCSMDDFGSGYSSLNLIQDIPVDTIKLDKVFFKSTARDLSRTESVIGSILTMSRALNMDTVAEGVETKEHVAMLKRLDCDFIQGFYFAKPMPIAEFEKLNFGEEITAKTAKK